MDDCTLFVGAGDVGDKIANELLLLSESMEDNIFYEKDRRISHYLRIRSFPCKKANFREEKDCLFIIAGAICDPCWQKARETIHKNDPYFMLTIGAESRHEAHSDVPIPFKNECLFLTDPSLVKPVEIAQLVLQIFFIHMPWNICQMGSLIGYDLGDTNSIFAGKVIAVRKVTSAKECYRQDFLKFLNENRGRLSQSEGVLMSLWGQDKVLSLRQAIKLMEETQQLTMSDATVLFTQHILPNSWPDFMAILFIS